MKRGDDRHLKLNALKRLVWETQDTKIHLIDHVKDGLRVILRCKERELNIVLQDDDRPEDMVAYAKEILKGL